MKLPVGFFRSLTILWCLSFVSGPWGATIAAELPKTLVCAICQKAPVIDGKIGTEEWQGVPVIEFDLTVLHIKEKRLAKRNCQLWIMNSSNGLYVALRVPDSTLNKSLTPLNFDFATLAFSRGKELAAGDDRKSVAPGIYLDKHFVSPGKDIDDKQVDGKGAMVMDRYAGQEWLPTELVHLDLVESERFDVLRGLKTYVAASEENATTFRTLYGNLQPEKRVLPEKFVRELVDKSPRLAE